MWEVKYLQPQGTDTIDVIIIEMINANFVYFDTYFKQLQGDLSIFFISMKMSMQNWKVLSVMQNFRITSVKSNIHSIFLITILTPL